jgi:hypothetical protein
VIECEVFPYLKFLLKWVGEKVANQKDSRYGSEVVYVLFSKKEAFILRVAGVVKDSPVVCKDDEFLPDPLVIDIAVDFYMPFACASPSITRPNLIGSVLYNAKLRYLARDDVGSLTDCGYLQWHLGNHLRLPIIRQKPVQGAGSMLLPCRWVEGQSY